MTDANPDMGGVSAGQRPRSAEDKVDVVVVTSGISGIRSKEDVETLDVYGVQTNVESAEEAFKAYAGLQDKPSMIEVLGWFLYKTCSYFIHTVLIPIVFPLIISKIIASPTVPPAPAQGWEMSFKGLACKQKEMKLYQGLTYRSIMVSTMSFSPLEWTSISWFVGLIVAIPILGKVSIHLDYGHHPQLLAGAATAVGAIFCLPAGFFNTHWIFPPYIVAIIAANMMGSASHARHLGLMIQGFIGSSIRKSQYPDRKAVSSWLSLYSTAVGCLGAALMSSFTYHMLKGNDNYNSLWIVSIFSGLLWFIGIVHIFVSDRPGENTSSSLSCIPKTHLISIFKFPHAAGSLAGVFLSSFATMCMFMGVVLYLVGEFCFKPVDVLYLWLTYFIFPLLSLPLLYPLQQLIRADAVKMQLLGFLLTTLVSGFGYYFRRSNWHYHHMLIFAAVQSTATGVLQAFGRVLLLDCSPAGKEGAFAAWFSWVRALGTCAGFALATASPRDISRTMGFAFCSAIVGIIVLIFGNISNFGGAIAAGHIKDHSEKGSPPVHGLDNSMEMKGPVDLETSHEEGGRMDV